MRSDHVKKDIPTAPTRTLFSALCYPNDDMARPLIAAVVSHT